MGWRELTGALTVLSWDGGLAASPSQLCTWGNSWGSPLRTAALAGRTPFGPTLV